MFHKTRLTTRTAARHLLRRLSSASSPSSPFPHLLSPLPLGAAGTLANRVVMGSMHTGVSKAMTSFLV
jgi:hypothetical protein